MFILYALVIGLAVGFLAHGRPAGLAQLHFQWPWVMLGGLLVQVLLFSDVISSRIGAAGPPIYAASTAAVVLAVLANRRITGMPIVALGAACNFTAIMANGGFMPAALGALQARGHVTSTVYSNSVVLPDPALAPLTDIFALPAASGNGGDDDITINSNDGHPSVFGRSSSLPRATARLSPPSAGLVRRRTDPTGKARWVPSGHGPAPGIPRTVQVKGHFVLPLERSSRANPPRGGDAKPGISPRPPGRRSRGEPTLLEGEHP